MKKAVIKSPKDRGLLLDEELETIINKLEQILQSMVDSGVWQYSFSQDQTGIVFKEDDSIGIIFRTSTIPNIDKYFDIIRERYISAGYKEVFMDRSNFVGYTTNTLLIFNF